MQEAVAELGSLVKKKQHELSQLSRKFGDLSETLDCVWTAV